MPKINKLMLVRKAAVNSTLLDRMGASKFLKGEPVAVSPQTWNDEAGESHYAYSLQGMLIKDLAELDNWIQANEPTGAISFHELNDEADKPIDIEAALARVGLRINEAVE